MNALFDARPIVAGSAPAEPALVVSGLHKSFGAHEVLNGIDLVMAAGQATALIGANGSGKSTLLRCLVRLTEPSSGTVAMLGREVGTLSPAALRRFRSNVGIVWQKHNLVPRLSALSNVLHGVQARMSGPRAWFHGLAPAAVRTEAMDCLAHVGLANRALARVDSLSGGQQQRVAIARMLMQRPAFILADEPDASLDPQTGDEVMDLLNGLVRYRGLSLLVISHRMDHALRYSDRIVGLSRGMITLDVPTRQATASGLRHFFEPGAE